MPVYGGNFLPNIGGTLTGGLTVALGTITADTQNISSTATWNNAGVTFTALKLNVTDSASNAASLLIDLQKAGTSQFKVDKSGNTTIGGSLLGPGADWPVRAASGFSLFLEADGGGSSKRITWSGATLGMPASSLVLTAASVTAMAGLRLPHGAAPTSPVNGDMWTTTAGLFVQINGVTKTVTLT